MALYIWLLLALTQVDQGYGESLDFPPKFTLKVRRMELTAGIIEDIQIWYTETKSRIDYNNGASTSIVMRDRSWPNGITYYIHPKASLNQSSHAVCYCKNTGSVVYKFLPERRSYEQVASEVINFKLTTKIEAKVTEEKYYYIHTLWLNVLTESYFIPVRYEKVVYNIELGSKYSHEILEYSELSTNFSTQEVFDIKYKCKRMDKSYMEVTKNLMFINPEDDEHVDYVFNTFKKDYERNYADVKEHNYRKKIFQDNMRQIVAANNKNLGYKLGINQFADKTPKEMNKHTGLRRQWPASKTGNIPFPYTESKIAEMTLNLPREYDLRLYGLVTKVKNQDQCGSCLPFTVTAVAEGALARSNGGRLLTLAEQALIDCMWQSEANGCLGAPDDSYAYEWMMEYGLPAEAEYGPYKNRDGICNIKNMTKLYPIRGFTTVTPLSVRAIKIALINHGPLSVLITAKDSFHRYSSGIFNDTESECKHDPPNHGAVIVGYGERNGETFWILKNSWGPQWGIDGYMHMSAVGNVCGVASAPKYVVF